MSKDKKVMIPHEVAEELKETIERYGHEGRAYLMLEMCGSCKGHTHKWLKEKGNLTILASVLDNGYETPEEALLEKYKEGKKEAEEMFESQSIGYVEGITDTLEILGIKIEGINE